MWRSANNAGPDHFVIIGNPGSRRVLLFQAALARLQLPQAHIASYLELISGRITLPDLIPRNAVVRIESPGKDFDVERAMLELGAEIADDETSERISRRAVADLQFERGRILYPRQWYLGYCETLRIISRQLSESPAESPVHRLMNSPAEIAVMFDKRRCHQLLREHGVDVPRSLGPIQSFDNLIGRMREFDCFRVFIKLAHGSSASGVVAYQTDGSRHQAATTVEMVRSGGRLHLYNSRRVRVYRDLGEIAELIDALCRHTVHVEQWMPKAGFDNRTFDLRVVMIGRSPRQTVARLSRSPLTNLHLLNDRKNADSIRAKMGQAAWESAMSSCERVKECFPESLHIGIDLLVLPGFRRHAVAEVNAFGDLLPGVLWEGEETYTTEILAM
jgi:hypothetical protein